VVDVTPLYETRTGKAPSTNHEVPHFVPWTKRNFDAHGSFIDGPRWNSACDVTGTTLDANAAWEENALGWNAYLLTDENANHFGKPEFYWLECGEATDLQHLFPLALTGGQVFTTIAKASLPDLMFSRSGQEQMLMVHCKVADFPARVHSLSAENAVEVRRPTESSTVAGDLVAWIEEQLPDRSIEDLARLVSVSRATWSGWRRGDQVIRSGSRHRLIRLKRLLELRGRVAPESSLNLWLDTPVGSDLEVTPASLLNQGRDATVAMLAAQPSDVHDDGLVLTMPMDLGGLEDDDATAAKLDRRASVAGSEEAD
jgi:hypothetical protein